MLLRSALEHGQLRHRKMTAEIGATHLRSAPISARPQRRFIEDLEIEA